jgi:2-polyprenyl-6-methoxyphenol hydroxylase-like FAD-dependent oxidoreductase
MTESSESSESSVSRVLVVGGGIAGGVLSLALARRGVDVVLVDLRAELGGVGHGITLQGNALKAFHDVGVYDRIAERGFAFGKLRLRLANGQVLAEIPTPPMGGPDVPPTMGALRSDVADVLADELGRVGVDVRTRTTVTAIDDRGDSVVATLSDGSTETVDLVVGADGIRSQVRRMIGIAAEPVPVGMGIWRVVARRPPELECSELYQGGPKYRAGYTPISEDLCYAFLLEGNLDRSYVGEHPNGKLLKEHGEGYGGIWGQVRDSLADDAVVNYQWIEAVRIEGPWHRGRTVLVGDAAHACPPLIAQGAAMCAEDGVVLAELLTTSASVEDALAGFAARRTPRVSMVLDNSLQLVEWDIHPDTPGADPGRVMGQTLHALCAPA